MTDFATLNARFTAMGIDTTQPGFYDHPAFLEAEQQDPSILETYAQWVLLRSRTPEYEAHVRSVVPQVTNLVTQTFTSEEFTRSCLSASTMISRSLDRMGIWNFTVKGSMVFTPPSPKEPQYLRILDRKDTPNAFTGHVWVCVPPYMVVDATAGLQPWFGGATLPAPHTNVLIEQGSPYQASASDIQSPEHALACRMRPALATTTMHELHLHFTTFAPIFPARSIALGSTQLAYIPYGITASDVGLEDINSEGTHGPTGDHIWNNVIRPAFNL